MSITDMPLSELKTYMGSSPCPGDIDAFWDESVAGLKNIDADVEFIPSSFKAPGIECYEMYFTGAGGARIHAKFAKPASINGKAPAVLRYHGYTFNSGDWCEKLNYAATGFVTAALDCRGQGGLSEDNGQVKGNTLQGHIIRGLDEQDPRKLYYHNVFLDAVQLAHIIMALPYVDETRVGCYGASQGGALSFVCAALEPRINRIAPMFPFLSDYKRACNMFPVVHPYAELKEYFRSFDPLRKHEEEIYMKLGYIDIQNITPRIKALVRMYTGFMDDICPPSTQFAAYNKIPGDRKTFVLYPDFGHEMLPGCSDEVLLYMLEM